MKQAPPVVFADLGYGVLDSAMVETAAYCLEKVAPVQRQPHPDIVERMQVHGDILGSALEQDWDLPQ